MLPKLSQHGYIAETILVFMIFLSAVLYPYNHQPPKKTQSDCPIVGNAPDYGEEFIVQFPENAGNRQNTVDYILVRENVIIGGRELMFRSLEHAEQIPNTPSVPITKPDGVTKLYRPLFATDWGEFGLRDEFSQAVAGYYNFDEDGNQGGGNRVYNLYKEGFLFAQHLTDTGSPIIVDFDPTNPDSGEPPYGEVADLYQMKSIHDDPARSYDDNAEAYECSPNARFIADVYPTAEGFSKGASVVVPPQEFSTDSSQLQLEWFEFTNPGGAFFSVHCKPAVYLYPQTTQLVNVKVKPKGELIYVDPPYDMEKGWTVWAEPGGQLTVSSYQLSINTYDYLYYESKIRDDAFKKPEKGWVLKYKDLPIFYKEILPKLGLNSKEEADFIEYWTKHLPDSPYYFVGIVDQKMKDYIEPLTVIPKPDSSIRFSLYFEKLEKPRTATPPEVITPLRKGFTLVEWGGMIKNDLNHPFTCSQ